MSDIITASIVTGVFSVIGIIISSKLSKIHTLVNSQMGIQLRLNAANSRWRAEASKKPEDLAAANEAETLLYDHDKQQRKVDTQQF